MATWLTSGHARDKARTRLRRQGSPCWLCGKPIDYTLKTPDPGSFELDHKLPRITHPELDMDPNNWAPSHRACNRAKSDGPVIGTKQVPTSRRWL